MYLFIRFVYEIKEIINDVVFRSIFVMLLEGFNFGCSIEILIYFFIYVYFKEIFFYRNWRMLYELFNI